MLVDGELQDNQLHELYEENPAAQYCDHKDIYSDGRSKVCYTCRAEEQAIFGGKQVRDLSSDEFDELKNELLEHESTHITNDPNFYLNAQYN